MTMQLIDCADLISTVGGSEGLQLRGGNNIQLVAWPASGFSENQSCGFLASFALLSAVL